MAKKTIIDEEVKDVKTTKQTSKKTDNKSDLQIELDKTKQEKDDMKQQIELLKQQIELMKQQSEQQTQMMMQVQQSMLMQQMNSTSNKQRNEKVEIVSYAWGRLSLCDNSGATVVTFKDSYIPETITYNQLQQLMTTKNKNTYFKKGLVAFIGESEKYYDEEGIVKPFVLSKENILSIYKNDVDTCFKKLDGIIAGDDRVKTAVFWQTIRMLAKNEIEDIQVAMSIPIVLQQYFKCRNYQSCIGQVNLLKDINYIE